MAELTQSRTVTSKQLKTILRHMLKTNRSTMIHSSPGIGKSTIVAELCNEMGGKLYDVRLSQKESCDIAGMPYLHPESKTMTWAHPVDIPTVEEASKYPIVFLFLDEINSAPPSVQAAAYSLLLDRKVGIHSLPDNCVVIAAGNKATDRSVVYSMPKALSNRMCHFELRVDFDSWNEWAINKGIHSDVVGFLNFSKNSLYDFDPKSPEHTFASPRTWEFTSDILKADSLDDDTAMNIIAGTIGEGLALKFMAHRKTVGKLPNPTDILTGKVKTLDVKDISAQYSLATSMLYELKESHPVMSAEGNVETWHKHSDNFLEYMMTNFGTEIQVMAMRMGLQTMNIPFNHAKMKSFQKFFSTTGKLILKSTNI